MIGGRLDAADQFAGGGQVAQVGAMKRVLLFQMRRGRQIEDVQVDLGRRQRAADPAADKPAAAGDQHSLTMPKCRIHQNLVES